MARQLSGITLHPLSAGEARSALWAPDPADSADRFLGRFTQRELLDELVVFGVDDGLRDAGYDDIELTMSGERSGRSTLDIRTGSTSAPLLELVMWREWLTLDPPPGSGAAATRMRTLTCEWLRLQDPARAFTPERPRLPGQRAPGNGLGMRVLAALQSWTTRLGADVLLVLPDYFHSAVLFQRAFAFVDPEVDALLQRAHIDLELHRWALATVSWAFEWGAVDLLRRSTPAGPWDRIRGWKWPSEAQVYAPDGPMAAWLESRRYREARASALERHRFEADREAIERHWPRVEQRTAGTGLDNTSEANDALGPQSG